MFSEDGIIITDLPYDNYEIVNDIVMQSDNKIILTGHTDASGDGDDVFVVRYLLDGGIDSSFHYDGVSVTDINGGQNSGNAICLQEDGKILIAAQAFDDEVGGDFALLRLLNESSLSASPENYFDNNLTIYPNPTANTFQLVNELQQLPTNSYNICVYSPMGFLCLQKEIISNQLVDISQLPSGIYIIKITDEYNNTTNKKLIKIAEK